MESLEESHSIQPKEHEWAKSNFKKSAPEKISAAIALILTITFSAFCAVSLILLTVAVSLDRITFAEAKDVFGLLLVALVALTGTSLGFYLGNRKQ